MIRGKERRHVRARSTSAFAPVLIAVVVQLVACSRGPSRQAVVLRLDQKRFGTARLPHTPVARIGGVVRSVPFPRDPSFSRTVAVPTVRDGRARVTVSLPPEIAALPTRYFTLTDLGARSLDEPDEDGGSAGAPPSDTSRRFVSVLLERGWRLRPSPRTPGVAKIAALLPRAGASTVLELRVLRAMPRRLESDAFDVPAGATVALSYGLARPGRAARDATVCFTATLDCAWRWRRTLVSECVRVADEGTGRWHDAERTLWTGGDACRLVLATDAVGPDGGDAAWAVPVVRTAVPDDPAPIRNVILVSLDTLRADHLSGFGYARPTSPAFDELLMKRGATFTNASTTFPVTNVAHLSVFTGNYPGGLPARGVLSPDVDVPMLTELLRDAGFTTLGITEDALVSMEFGFGFGFDSLTELHPAPKDRARLVLAGARELIRSLATERFFLFLHTYKVHRPYEPSAAYRSLYAAAPPPSDAAAAAIPERYRDARDAYDESIGELDALLAELLRDLDASGLSEQTLLVVLSDHGEAFGEHGLPGHGLSPYQEALHVPLVFRGPGVSPGLRIAVPVSLTDVAPTILDLLGLTIPEAMQGRSLRAALAGRALSPRPIYFEWLGGQNRGVRFGNWKLFDGGAPGMVELRSDPLERGPRPVSEASPALTAMLRAYDRDTATRRASLHQPATPTAISPDVDANLRALGYVE